MRFLAKVGRVLPWVLIVGGVGFLIVGPATVGKWWLGPVCLVGAALAAGLGWFISWAGHYGEDGR